MDTRKTARLRALREAARIGIEDMKAGRFRSFESPMELKLYLAAITDETIAQHGICRLSPWERPRR